MSRFLNRPGLRAAAAAALIVTALGACSSGGDSDAKGDAVVKYAATPGDRGFLAVWVAEDKGFFKGIKTQQINAESGPAINTMLLGGTVDVTELSTIFAMQDIEQGKQVRLISGNVKNVSFPILAGPKSGLPTGQASPDPKQLLGKKIGVPARGSLIEYQASALLKDAGLDPSKVTYVGIGLSPSAYASLKAGTVDAMFVDPINVPRLERDGFGGVWSNLSSLKSLDSQMMLSFATLDKTLKERPKDVQAFQDGVGQALDWMRDKNNLSELADIFIKHGGAGNGATPEAQAQFKTDFMAAMTANDGKLLDQFDPRLTKSLYEGMLNFAVEYKLVKAPIPYEDAVSESAQKAAGN